MTTVMARARRSAFAERATEAGPPWVRGEGVEGEREPTSGRGRAWRARLMEADDAAMGWSSVEESGPPACGTGREARRRGASGGEFRQVGGAGGRDRGGARARAAGDVPAGRSVEGSTAGGTVGTVTGAGGSATVVAAGEGGGVGGRAFLRRRLSPLLRRRGGRWRLYWSHGSCFGEVSTEAPGTGAGARLGWSGAEDLAGVAGGASDRVDGGGIAASGC